MKENPTLVRRGTFLKRALFALKDSSDSLLRHAGRLSAALWFLTLASGSVDIASAATSNGFMRGGGIGSVGCPAFLNEMAIARQTGSLDNVKAVTLLNSYYQYVIGFQTAFNMESEGTFDIFGAASFGNWPSQAALIAVEPYCAAHPDKLFDDALFDLVERLR